MILEPAEEPEAGGEGELNLDEEAVQKAVEAYDDLGEVIEQLRDVVGEPEGGEEPMDLGAEEPAEEPMDLGDEEDLGAEDEEGE